MMHCKQTRRDWLIQAASAAACLTAPALSRAAAPAGPVSVARCKTYTPAELLPVMQKMFDQLGGLGRLVSSLERQRDGG